MLVERWRVPRTEIFPDEAEPFLERHDGALVRAERHAQLVGLLTHDPHRLPGVIAVGCQRDDIVGVPDQRETRRGHPCVELAEDQVRPHRGQRGALRQSGHLRGAAAVRGGLPSEKRLDQIQEPAVFDQYAKHLPESRDRDGAEAVVEVGSCHPAQALIAQPGDRLHGVGDTEPRPVGVAERTQPRVDHGLLLRPEPTSRLLGRALRAREVAASGRPGAARRPA